MRLPLLRTEISTNFDSGESAEIYQLKYDPEHASIFRPMPASDSTGTSSKPIKIFSYDFQVATTTLTQMWQSYYDDNDYAAATNWNPGNTEFVQALKQEKLVAGHTNRYVTRMDVVAGTDLIGDADYEAATIADTFDWRVGTIKFRAGRWSKKYKKYIGGPAPIVLSPYKKNMISWHVANVGNDDARNYFATLRIKSWKQIV